MIKTPLSTHPTAAQSVSTSGAQTQPGTARASWRDIPQDVLPLIARMSEPKEKLNMRASCRALRAAVDHPHFIPKDLQAFNTDGILLQNQDARRKRLDQLCIYSDVQTAALRILEGKTVQEFVARQQDLDTIKQLRAELDEQQRELARIFLHCDLASIINASAGWISNGSDNTHLRQAIARIILRKIADGPMSPKEMEAWSNFLEIPYTLQEESGTAIMMACLFLRLQTVQQTASTKALLSKLLNQSKPSEEGNMYWAFSELGASLSKTLGNTAAWKALLEFPLLPIKEKRGLLHGIGCALAKAQPKTEDCKALFALTKKIYSKQPMLFASFLNGLGQGAAWMQDIKTKAPWLKLLMHNANATSNTHARAIIIAGIAVGLDRYPVNSVSIGIWNWVIESMRQINQQADKGVIFSQLAACLLNRSDPHTAVLLGRLLEIAHSEFTGKMRVDIMGNMASCFPSQNKAALEMSAVFWIQFIQQCRQFKQAGTILQTVKNTLLRKNPAENWNSVLRSFSWALYGASREVQSSHAWKALNGELGDEVDTL